MLSKENNEMLARVGVGTPLGNLMRQYWMPVLFSGELEADSPPERVRLLAEDLIAFRDSSGRPGMLAANCAHRGASLFFGRNEEDGLRCVYHGWKYDREGRCLDMPNEPVESNFRDKIRHTAYPCAERGGVIWTYLGPLNPPPPLSDLEWMSVPDEQRWLSKRVQYCNWLQALEGDFDGSHLSFLHTDLNAGEDAPAGLPTNKDGQAVVIIQARDRHPRFETIETDYGVVVGSGREVEEGMRYWRTAQFLMPFHTMTGPRGANPIRPWRAWVPIDDENVLVMGVNFHPLRQLTPDERVRLDTRSGPVNIAPESRASRTSQPFGAWRPVAGLENDFHIDRELQRTRTFSGIPEFWAQDAAMQISMGRIYDRSTEHLGTTDLGIIALRQRLLREAEALRDQGVTPESVLHPEWYQVRTAAVIIPDDSSWVDATDGLRKVVIGFNPDAV